MVKGSILPYGKNGVGPIAGGSVTMFGVWNNAAVVISGGSIYGKLYAFDNGRIYLHGAGFEIDGTALVHGDKLSDFAPFFENGENDFYAGVITGSLAEGSLFNNAFQIYNTGNNAGTADIVIVPEAAMVCLLGFGCLFMRKWG